MHQNLLQRRLFWLFSIFSILFFIIFLNLVDSGSYSLDNKSEGVASKLDSKNSISVYVQLNDFNSNSQTLKARIWVVPPKKYANVLGASSVSLNYDTGIRLSASSIENNKDRNLGFWQKDEILRAIDVELDTNNANADDFRNSDNWFPFDKYIATLSGKIYFRTFGSDTNSLNDDKWETLPVRVIPYKDGLSGWSGRFSYIEISGDTINDPSDEDKYFTTDIYMERSTLNKVILFLIGLIFLGGGLSMMLLFRSILLGHRPPTLSGLIWAGSTAFTMIQTRTIIPGAPRVGVKFDLFIFYPSLLVCFISGGLMFYHWVSKESWSREL